MESFMLTRKQMSALLQFLYRSHSGESAESAISGKSPLLILQEVWRRYQQFKGTDTASMTMMPSKLPIILEKLIRSNLHTEGLSLNEIVSLGNQVEYTSFSITSIQNWVKRDIKELICSPRVGKKYDLQQAAIILIVEDLRATLSFDAIRQLLSVLFEQQDQDGEYPIRPLTFYQIYSSLYEELDQNNDQVLDVHGHDPLRLHHDDVLELIIVKKTDEYMTKCAQIQDKHRILIRNALVIAITSVQTTYFQHLAKRYLHTMMLAQPDHFTST
ncbi:DUF1836 domain-containing protein [Paenibacillus taiwanensis]|uniref:DUF1836 domain-containing protein n=1 Tax=Paenibacillus taiwanensis TaxID=401638 RepID=UPI00041188F3|nr:DUF1836 domain-containing protein [Paenibacillus taiwanensis]